METTLLLAGLRVCFVTRTDCLKKRGRAYLAPTGGTPDLTLSVTEREIEAARADLVNWKLEFDASFDSENGGGVGVRPKPKYDMDAMYAQYPRAKAYLDAQKFAASENDAKSAAGKKALDAIINGENYEQAIAAMNSDWATHCEAHLWD